MGILMRGGRGSMRGRNKKDSGKINVDSIDVNMDNPFRDYVELTKEDLNLDTKIQDYPKKPDLIGWEEKEQLLSEIDSEIFEMRSKKISLNNLLSDLAKNY